MANLRKLAKGQNCQIRLENVCCHDPQTVVLAHLRMIGISAMGYKAPDLLGAWACSTCHAYVDSHKDDATQIAFYRGIFRTINSLIEDGVIKWQ